MNAPTDRVEVTVSISRALFDIIPDLNTMRVSRGPDKDRWTEIPKGTKAPVLEKMTLDTYAAIESTSKFGRETAMALIANNLLDEAEYALVLAVTKAALALREAAGAD